MVIYYGRDSAGRRVEVPVSQETHQQIQRAGGWRQSGAEAHYQQQIKQAESQVKQEKVAKAPPEKLPAPVTPKETAKEVQKAKVPWRPEIVEAYKPPVPLPLRPEIEERYVPRYEPKPLPPPKPKFLEPPEMPAIKRTAEISTIRYEAKPKAIIRPERVYERPPPKDVAESMFRTFEFLVPKRTEREIAYPSPRVGVRPIVEFGLGAAYGAVTFPAAVIKMPESIYTAVTRPAETITLMGEKFARAPGFFVGEIAGQVAVGYGIGKVVGVGIGKYRARAITTELEAGRYTFKDLAGVRVGLAESRAIFLRGKKVIGKAKIETIFKPAKPGEISPAVSRVFIMKPAKPTKLYAAARTIIYPELKGIYPGVSKAILFKKAKPIAAIYARGLTKIDADISRTIGAGITKPIPSKTMFGAVFERVRPPPPGIIRVAPKVIKPIKPGPPATVGVTTQAIAKGVAKVITKPSPAVARTGVLTGAITAFVGRARPVPAMLEEELYVSPKAARVVGVTAMSRAATMRRFGLTQQTMGRTLTSLGVGRALMPAERMAAITGVTQVPRAAQIQRPVLRLAPRLALKPAVETKLAVKAPVVPTVPSTVPVIPIALLPMPKRKPLRRRRRKRPKFKYREIRHPFPTIRELIGA